MLSSNFEKYLATWQEKIILKDFYGTIFQENKKTNQINKCFV